jgi:hypothetical protein
MGWREEHDPSRRVWTSQALADEIVRGLLDLSHEATKT